MAKNTPAFQFYPADYLIGTTHLSLEAQGLYMRLLAYQWTLCRLPTDHQQLAKLGGCDVSSIARLLPEIEDKFCTSDDGQFMVNARLDSELRKQSEKRLARQKAGRKGGKAKASNATFLLKQKPSKGSMKLEEEDRSLKKKKKEEVDYSPLEHYRDNYHPKYQAKPADRKLVRQRYADGYSASDLIQAIDGNHLSPFHCGENDRGTKYHRLGLILHPDKIDGFIDVAINGPGIPNAERLSRNMRAAAQAASLFDGVPEVNGQRRIG